MLPPLAFVWSYSIVTVETWLTSPLAGSICTRIGIGSSSSQLLRLPETHVELPLDCPWRVAKLAAEADEVMTRRPIAKAANGRRNVFGRRGFWVLLTGILSLLVHALTLGVRPR